MKLRYSISRLMSLVLFIAIGLAAAMAGAFTFVVVALSAATLCALLRHGPGRAFYTGCALFGWSFMLLAFGVSPEVRRSLPTIWPIVRVYKAVYGPGPTSFKTPEDAFRWITQTGVAVNGAITMGHSLIALVLAFIGGSLTWKATRWWMARENRRPAQTIVGGPIALKRDGRKKGTEGIRNFLSHRGSFRNILNIDTCPNLATVGSRSRPGIADGPSVWQQRGDVPA